jgi:serine protease Do
MADNIQPDCIPAMLESPLKAEQLCKDKDASPAQLNLIALYEEKGPSVVHIVSTRNSGAAFGSGFFVRPDGVIATEYHNVRDASQISVITSDHKRFNATILDKDIDSGVALLKLEQRKPGEEFPTVTLVDGTEPNDFVAGLGNPYAEDLLVAAPGTVDEVTKLKDVHVLEGIPADENLEHDLIIAEMVTSKGFSGGPFFRQDGQAVGMMAFGGGGRYTGAVPSRYITRLLARQPQD